MSWLVRSIANTLTLDGGDNDSNPNPHPNPNPIPNPNPKGTGNSDPKPGVENGGDPSSPTRGVKEDISELTKTLTRQFWGVASFLAPPPQAEPYKPIKEPDHNNPDGKLQFESSSDTEGSEQKIAGIRSDFAEIGGRFKSGISKLSSNVHVSEFTKIASNLLQLGPDNENSEEFGAENDSVRGAVVGVTEEVVAFARDISMHPETWLDFPLPVNDDEDDFHLSDTQQEHALAVERLAPRLGALRIELCPGYMSEGCFWMVYFVLLHPRLNKQDAELLSTPQIVKARALLSQELKSHKKSEDLSGEGTTDPKDSDVIEHRDPLYVPSRTEFYNVPVSYVESHTSEMKYPDTSNEIPVVDKSVIEENIVGPEMERNVHSDSSSLLVEKDEDDGDDWLKEESSEYGVTSGANISIENEEDVSFSDLEEDDEDATATKKISYSSDKDTRDWVQLSKSSADSSSKVTPNNLETKETNDWLDVDDIDEA